AGSPLPQISACRDFAYPARRAGARLILSVNPHGRPLSGNSAPTRKTIDYFEKVLNTTGKHVPEPIPPNQVDHLLAPDRVSEYDGKIIAEWIRPKQSNISNKTKIL
ncbi:MAG TPA: hypothetical protein PJ988_09070, partial [Anaerolinea sp.]|nr:hypothetical protein [Anaerolinea sp.]